MTREDDAGARAAARDVHLDLRGLHCPMPVLRAKKALRAAPPGCAVTLDCTDPLSVIDIPHFVAQAGHDLVGQERIGDVYRYRIVRRG